MAHSNHTITIKPPYFNSSKGKWRLRRRRTETIAKKILAPYLPSNPRLPLLRGICSKQIFWLTDSGRVVFGDWFLSIWLHVISGVLGSKVSVWKCNFWPVFESENRSGINLFPSWSYLPLVTKDIYIHTVLYSNQFTPSASFLDYLAGNNHRTWLGKHNFFPLSRHIIF